MEKRRIKANGEEKEVSIYSDKVVQSYTGTYRAHSDGGAAEEIYVIAGTRLSDGNSIDGLSLEFEREKERLLNTYFSSPESRKGTRAGQSSHKVKAPMPGLVRVVNVSLGDIVEKTSQILVLEAMKMENSVRAGQRGKIVSIHAREGKNVEKNEVLVEIEAG
jgi:biotin carboxyl carrier protein